MNTPGHWEAWVLPGPLLPEPSCSEQLPHCLYRTALLSRGLPMSSGEPLGKGSLPVDSLGLSPRSLA